MLVFGEEQLDRLLSCVTIVFDRIYVDAVINHMAAGGNTGSAGKAKA